MGRTGGPAESSTPGPVGDGRSEDGHLRMVGKRGVQDGTQVPVHMAGWVGLSSTPKTHHKENCLKTPLLKIEEAITNMLPYFTIWLLFYRFWCLCLRFLKMPFFLPS